jgi:predicted ribosome quality control (RQC) complex YloA/Tae2 family protein
MKISIDITKTVDQNASYYFEQAKLGKKKLEGAKKALEHSYLKLKNLEVPKEKQKRKIRRKLDWYEKFRWFYTTDNMLFISGRDATTNEVIIKKHLSDDDIVFHSEMAGSPFGVLKGGKKAVEETKQECAHFIASYSKAWRTRVTMADIFYVNPDQVTKEAPSGEFISKGSFMIYGKKTILSGELKLFIGKMEDGKVMAGPLSAVKTHCKEYVGIIQGEEKTSEIAKKIKQKIKADDLDDIVKVIPVGSKLA